MGYGDDGHSRVEANEQLVKRPVARGATALSTELGDTCEEKVHFYVIVFAGLVPAVFFMLCSSLCSLHS